MRLRARLLTRIARVASRLLMLLPLTPQPAAQAGNQVNVHVVDSVGRPMDGTVTLTGQAGSGSCRTVAARCSVSVPAGTYTATLVPVRELPPPPITVQVQVGGVAQIVLRSIPDRTTSPTGPTRPAEPKCPPPPASTGASQVNIRVVDSLGRPMDGTVTLRGQACTCSCRTVAARCTLYVPPGSYSASLAPVREGPPPPRTVAVPLGRAASVVFRSVASPEQHRPIER